MNYLHAILVSLLFVGCAVNDTIGTYRSLEVVRDVDVQNLTETIVAELDGHQYMARARLRIFTKNDIQDHRHWFGVDGGLPKYVVDSITLERDGKIIDIPRDLYSDFGDIFFETQQASLRLKTYKNKILLEYGGSDGAGSYYAEFYFKDNTFDRMSVRGCGRNIERR